MRFARELMLKHNVSEGDLADVHVRAAREEREEYARGAAYSTGTRGAAWEAVLAQTIADVVGSVGVYTDTHALKRSASGGALFGENGKPSYGTAWQFYGPAADVRDAVAMFAEWQVTIAAMARMKWGGALRGDGADYAKGFSFALYNKVRRMLEEERERVRAAADAKALVLSGQLTVMDRKRKLGAAWLREQGVTLSSARHASSARNGDAYRDGHSDGSRANISRNAPRRIGQ